MAEPTQLAAVATDELFQQAQRLVVAMRDDGLDATFAKGVCIFAAVIIAKMNDQTLAQLQQEVESVFNAIHNDRTVN